MNTALANRLSQLTIAPPQQFRNLTAFPIIGKDLADPDHLMLEESLAKGFLTVEEISEGGSVPELVVVNDSDHFVLLLDGEEVSGAKQNRVLNTSILLDKRSRTRVPVSCTEAGRWAYTSATFAHSGNIMSRKLRQRKSRSVSESLKFRDCYESNQSDVWASISELHQEAGTQSPTSAMKDAYESRKDQLKEFAEAIRPVENQVGLLVFVNHKPAGLDLFARPQSYAKVAKQLAESYAMDAITSRATVEDGTLEMAAAATFLGELTQLTEDPFKSIGIGSDFRYEGSHRNGSALLVGETPVHASFFYSEDELKPEGGPGRMPFRRRLLSRNLPQEHRPEGDASLERSADQG